MNKIILAVIAVVVSAGAVNAFELESTNAADILKAAQTEKFTAPLPAPAAVNRLTADQERQWQQWLHANIARVQALIGEVGQELNQPNDHRLVEIQKEVVKIQEISSQHDGDENFDRFELICTKVIIEIHCDYALGEFGTRRFIGELTALDAEIYAESAAQPPTKGVGENYLNAAQTEQIAIPAVSARRPALIKESFNLRVDKILQPDSCAGSFVQVNGHEPLATCDIELGYDGVIDSKAVWPMLLSTELEYQVGPDQSISCTGGFRRDAGLYGKTQVFVSLTPVRTDYPKEYFSACYKKVITGLSAKNRALYFDVVRPANIQ
ncbi:MAG: hypothetical protein NTY45_10285 [Elusimicrobia bacterium]|nr:hypothetical protein [Elusimicrobiota bacterium]